MTNQLDNKGDGDQNNALGDGAIAKQVNNSRGCATNSGSGAVAQNGGTAAGQEGIALSNSLQLILPSSEQGLKSPPPYLLPAQDAVFLHREAEVAWLDEHLQPDKVVAICGPGGMGKSALAARAVRKLPAARFPDGIVFHSFYHQPDTAMALQTIAHAFGLPTEGALAHAVRHALAHRKALLILDGAEEAADLPAILNLRGSCGVLITSRRRSDAPAARLDLRPLSNDQSEDVLRAWGEITGDQAAVEHICDLLGGWPVGLRIVGRYLSSTGESAVDYLRWLEQEPFKELGDGEHQTENAALLLQCSVAGVSDDSRLILGLAGCLAFAPLATKPMTALLEGDERRGRTAINELVNYGLLERRGEYLHIGHALIHQYAANHLPLSRDALIRLVLCQRSILG